MDRTQGQGYSLSSHKFCSDPLPYKGIKGVNLSLQELMDFLSAEDQNLLQKRAVYIIPLHDRQNVFSVCFLVPKKIWVSV